MAFYKRESGFQTSPQESPVVEPESKRRKENYQNEDINNHSEEVTEIRDTSLADIWREIHGQSNWAGMLDPINTHLRSELIRYGEMAQACYDAFDKDRYSKYCGSCKFKPRDFFKSLGWEKEKQGYEVSRYIYSTYNHKISKFFIKCLHLEKWSPSTNWIGYIAVSDDETSKKLGRRDIVIAWRGTVTELEWVADFKSSLKPVSRYGIHSSVQVEKGFLRLYTENNETCRFAKYSARDIVRSEIERLKEKYTKEEKYKKDELSITITGHSLGSALAILSAYDIAETVLASPKDRRAIPISVFSFSGPRVGNKRFKERLEGLGVKVLRVVNVHDMVPSVPAPVFNERALGAIQAVGNLASWSYYHVGHKLALDHKRSPYLKEKRDLGCFHNLEVHLHLLDGYHDKERSFLLPSERDPVLVNKGTDFLKDEYIVPPNWSQSEKRGLVRNRHGHWVVPDRDDLDEHLPPEDIKHYLWKLEHRRLAYKNGQSSILAHSKTI